MVLVESHGGLRPGSSSRACDIIYITASVSSTSIRRVANGLHLSRYQRALPVEVSAVDARSLRNWQSEDGIDAALRELTAANQTHEHSRLRFVACPGVRS